MSKNNNSKDSLGDRMKKYESVFDNTLVSRTPVIIRLDGRAFHSFTKGFEKPFDDVLIETMQRTTKELCENIQGCVLGYTQSDEITLVLVDYKELNTDSWVRNRIQKMTSLSASLATRYFNDIFLKLALKKYMSTSSTNNPEIYKIYQNKVGTATFDSRVFNVPKEEVCNCLIWRQQDCERNSIQMVGQSNYSHKELHGVSCKEMVTKLEEEKGIVWGDLSTHYKRGTCVIKKENEGWYIDLNIPRFNENRDYIENLIYIN